MHKLLTVLLLMLVAAGCFPIHVDLGPRPGPLTETTLDGSGKERILLLDVSGELSSFGGRSLLGSSESIVSLVYEQLRVARGMKDLRAVVLRINSPGGTVTASDQLYREVERFREETGVPVYAVMMDVAASGGYYLAMAADRIYAGPTTITGSIGVIMVNVSVEGMMEKIGVSSKVVKSGPHKDDGSPLKDFTPEEREVLQQVIDDLFARFVDVVIEGRGDLDPERIRELADGRVYTAQQALDHGLVDEIGYLPEIVDALREELDAADARLVSLHRPGGQPSNLFSSLAAPEPAGLSVIDTEALEPLAGGLGRQGFYYLWEPGLF